MPNNWIELSGHYSQRIIFVKNVQNWALFTTKELEKSVLSMKNKEAPKLAGILAEPTAQRIQCLLDGMNF